MVQSQVSKNSDAQESVHNVTTNPWSRVLPPISSLNASDLLKMSIKQLQRGPKLEQGISKVDNNIIIGILIA